MISPWGRALAGALMFVTTAIGAQTPDDDFARTYQLQHEAIAMDQTQGGLISTVHASGDAFTSLSYDVNLDLSFTLFNLDFTGNDPVRAFPRTQELTTTGNSGLAISNFLIGLSTSFLSSFDFRMGQLYSDPVIVKYQSPRGEFYLENLGPTGAVRSHLGAGFTHESNGEFLETSGDFNAAAQIGNGQLSNQSLASMGWNFFFLRYSLDLSMFGPVPLTLFGEYRPADERFWGIQDRINVTSTVGDARGILAYDGIRAGLAWFLDPQQYLRLVVITGAQSQHNWGMEASAALLLFREIPLHLGLKAGYATSPAWYFDQSLVFTVGLRIPTTFFGTDLVRKVVDLAVDPLPQAPWQP